jgi:formimidoylglutamate deiminase
MSRLLIQADLTWLGGTFASGVTVAVGVSGRVESVGPARHSGSGAFRRMEGMALLPGFVNAHSHAFQRGLRGAVERFSPGSGSFWTWREAMYALAAALDREELGQICRRAFAEMRSAGITAVGEFHYLHHDRDRDWAFDDVVLEAAAEVGIRLVLLQACYSAGGIGRPLEPGQQRFATPDLPGYWRQWDRLARQLDPKTQSLGVVAHSVRAAGLAEIKALHAEAGRRRLPFHIHVEEQRREVEESVAAFGRTPMRVLCDELDTAEGMTAVHCTHTEPADMAAFLERGGRVCVCPLTEAHLGDGIPDLSAPHAAGGRLALGTDANTRISAVEEMRWMEYGQRLRSQRRGVLADARGGVAACLLDAATSGGAAALGIGQGRIAPGEWADFVAVNLGAVPLAGEPAEGLLEALVFGAGNEAIAGTFVGGKWRASD